MSDVSTDAAILVHIGFPKAGSTWLQRQIFDDHSLGFCMPWGEQADIAVEHVLVTDTFLFDEKIDDLRAHYRPVAEQSRERGLVPVVSYEHLLVDPMGGRLRAREGTRRLSRLFPNGRILLIIREQNAIILSAYVEHLRRGFTTPIERFLGFPEFRRLGFGPICPLDMFCYHYLIKHLHDTFGRDRVLVWPLEKARTKEFSERLAEFAGIDASRTDDLGTRAAARVGNDSDYVTLRLFNKIGTSRYVTHTQDTLLRKAAYGAHKMMGRIVPQQIAADRKARLGARIAEFTANHFDDSNRRTAQLIGMDLKSLGYAMADPR